MLWFVRNSLCFSHLWSRICVFCFLLSKFCMFCLSATRTRWVIYGNGIIVSHHAFCERPCLFFVLLKWYRAQLQDVVHFVFSMWWAKQVTSVYKPFSPSMMLIYRQWIVESWFWNSWQWNHIQGYNNREVTSKKEPLKIFLQIRQKALAVNLQPCMTTKALFSGEFKHEVIMKMTLKVQASLNCTMYFCATLLECCQMKNFFSWKQI